MDNLSLPFIFPKVSSPASSENEMSLKSFASLPRTTFPALSDHGISNKFHSPLCRITEYQTNFIPRYVGSRNIKQISFPAFSDYGISNFIPRFVGSRNIISNFIPRFVGSRNIKQISFLALSDYGISNFIPRFVGLRNIKFHSPLCRIMEYQKTSFPGLPDYGRSLKFYFLKNVIPSVSGREVSLKSLSPLSYRSEPIR